MSPDPSMTAPIHGLGRVSPLTGLSATRFAPVHGNTPLAQCGCHSSTAFSGLHAAGSNQPMSRSLSQHHADVREADAEVERELTRHAPVVLDEELGLVEHRHGALVVVPFGVGVEVPERRVGPPQVGVERIGRVGVEVVGAGVARQRAGPPRPLVEEPGLHVVFAAQVGQVHREVVRVVRRQPGEALSLADRDEPRVRECVGTRERHVRQDVVRVVLGEILPVAGQVIAIVEGIPVGLFQRIYVLLRPVGAADDLEHGRAREGVGERSPRSPWC